LSAHGGLLDLNANVDGYPQINSYQGLLQTDGVPDGQGLPPLRIGARSGAVLFVPPRPTEGASGCRKRLVAHTVGHCSKSSTGASCALTMANRRMRGSVAEEGADVMFKEDDFTVEEGVSLFDLL